jgi:hypothetical protein
MDAPPAGWLERRLRPVRSRAGPRRVGPKESGKLRPFRVFEERSRIAEWYRSCDSLIVRETCVRCGKEAPETDTNYTLISARFGWRLSRATQQDGSVSLEWRCPECWLAFKQSRPARPVLRSVPAGGAIGANDAPPSSVPAATADRPAPAAPPLTGRPRRSS